VDDVASVDVKKPEEFRKRAPWKDEKVTERFIEAFVLPKILTGAPILSSCPIDFI
jgi:hypothetical protein